MSVPNLSSAACLGARLESVMYRQTHACTYRQTPGEYSANSGPDRLVPGSELSNLHFYCKGDICPKFYLFRLMLFSSVFDRC